MRFVKGETNFFFVGPVFLENVPVPSAALQADLIEVVHPAPSAHLTFCSARLCHFSLSGLDKPPAHPYNDMCLFGVRVQEAPGSNPGTPTKTVICCVAMDSGFFLLLQEIGDF